jgi:hypothetical protein
VGRGMVFCPGDRTCSKMASTTCAVLQLSAPDAAEIPSMAFPHIPGERVLFAGNTVILMSSEFFAASWVRTCCNCHRCLSVLVGSSPFEHFQDLMTPRHWSSVCRADVHLRAFTGDQQCVSDADCELVAPQAIWFPSVVDVNVL